MYYKKKVTIPFLTLVFLICVSTPHILQAQNQITANKNIQTDKNYITSEAINSLLTSSVIVVSEKINYVKPLQPNNDFSFFSNNSINPFDDSSQDSGNDEKKKLGSHLSEALGSGAIFKKNKNSDGTFTYNVVTNAHVINTFDTLWLVLSDDSFFPAQLIGMETEYDIAVLAFRSDRNLPIAVFGDSDIITEGDLVFAIGNPFGISFTVTQGIVSQAKRYTQYTSNKKSSISFGGPFIQIDAAINKGNSGGVLANSEGKVIGINTFIVSSVGAQNIGLNFAIPINYVIQSIGRIFLNTPLISSWIGILTYDLPLRIRHALDITNRGGIFINNIILSSQAYKAGLRNGDLIISVDSKKVISRDGFSSVFEEIARKPIGSSTDIEVQRLTFKKLDDTTAISFTYTTLNFSVNLEKRPDLESTEIQKSTQKLLWPGMVIKPLENYEKELFGLSDKEEGVIITHIFKGTPAFNTKLKKHDIIIAVDNTLLLSFVHYLDIMRNVDEQLNPTIKLTVLRSAELIDINLQRPNF